MWEWRGGGTGWEASTQRPAIQVLLRWRIHLKVTPASFTGTGRLACVGLMLGQRLGRWPSIKLTQAQLLLFYDSEG